MNKSTPDFNRLRMFHLIYSTGSISGAAELVNTTPSAVSQQLSKLEKELGVQLFASTHKRLVATGATASLYAAVHPFVVALEKTVAGFHASREVPSGMLRIGCPVEFGKIMMPRLIAGFRKTYGKVVFQLKIGRTSEMLPLVDGGEVDFAFMDSFPAEKEVDGVWKAISLQPVFQETVVLAFSRQYAEERLKGDHSFANLIRQHYIAQQQDARAIRNWFSHVFGKKWNEPDIVLTVANHQAVVNALLCHMGLGIVVSQLVAGEIASAKLHVVETGKENPVNMISLAQLMDKVPTLAEKKFKSYVVRKLEGLAPAQAV